MSNDRSGIYQIKCAKNGHIYIGSSKHIYNRWTQHRRELRGAKSNCRYLQHAWTKHGEEFFTFKVIEECPADHLETREQAYIDLLKPKFNSITDVRRRFGAEARAKLAAATRARAALITHCPFGHEYTAKNTYLNKKNKRICRACSNARTMNGYATETAEQREERRARVKLYYESNHETARQKQDAYAAAHKAEKAEYDRQHRKEFSAKRLDRRHSETHKQRDHRLRLKRESYRRCKGGVILDDSPPYNCSGKAA